MKVVYRLEGLGGGKWRVSGLVNGGVEAVPIETEYKELSGVEEAVDLSKDLFIKRIQGRSDRNDRFELFTNAPQSAFESFDNEIEELGMDYNARYNYTPDNLPDTEDLWTISDYIWDDGRYDINPLNYPSPPYTIYTDASYWPNYNGGSCSVGFVIRGVNGGAFVVGSPVTDGIHDNNVAEYYAVRSALSFIPEQHEVEVKTDSTNVEGLMDEESDNPRFDIVSELEELIGSFDSISIEYVDRKWTTVADELAEISRAKPVLIGQEPRKSA